MKKIILLGIVFLISISIFQNKVFAKYNIEKSYVVAKIQIDKEEKIIDLSNEIKL